MNRFAFLLLAATTAFADRAADDAAWEAIRVKQERPLLMETPLVSNGVAAAAIVPAEDEPWKSAAAKLQAAVAAKTGVTLPIVAPAKITDADWAGRHLIVIGNLLNNPVFARLYFNYFACADAAYTGAGGYELRSIHDPWGNGHNVIALGAQDVAGLEAGVSRFITLVNERTKDGELKLSRLMELKLTKKGRRAPLEPKLSVKEIADRKETIANIYARPGTERGAAHQMIKFAMQYHRTGDPGWLELYRDAMRQHMNYYATNEYILQEGPRRYDRDFRDSWAYAMVIAWDLVEEAPGWSNEERLKLTNHVLRMVWESNLYQGWDRPASVAAWRKFDSVTHNHHTWPGLADLFGGWYFSRHYKLPVAKDWLDIGLGMFRSCSRSCKPWEDSAGYQWIPQRHVLMYALASGDRTFIEQGHAAQTGKAALQALDSLGRQPAWGDCGGFTSVSGMPELMCALEYATGDGRYRWAIEWLGVDARDEMEAPYWTNIAPKRPDDLTGVAVTYLPKMHYDLFGLSKRDDIWQKANLPFADTFDKLTLRSGWAEDDDYLLLDGTAAGSHGHLDGNCIIAFTAAGAQWLVDAEYIRRITKYHCAVTVLRNGVGSIMPPSARLDHAVWFGNGALTRTTMPHYNGMTWTRNIVFVPKRYVAVIDELTAEQAGDYSLRCCWRVAGESTLDGDTLRAQQRERGFVLRNLSGQRQELVYIKDFDGLPIHQLYQRASRSFQKGETVRFVNVFAAGKNGVPTIEASWKPVAAVSGRRDADGKIRERRSDTIPTVSGVDYGTIIINGNTEMFGIADAMFYRLADNEEWLVGATKFVAGGKVLLDSKSPIAAKLDGDSIAFGKPQSVPAHGLRPSQVIGEPQSLTRPLEASSTVAEPAKPKPVAAPKSTAALAGAKPLQTLWRFADFPVTPRPLKIAAIRSEPPPREAYSPLERLVDGASNGSTTSCMFMPGKTATITLDLGAPQRVREVHVKAWEKHDGWKTKRLALSLSNDDFKQDIRPTGELKETGSLSFGSNVNTIRTASPDQTARYVRITGEPATPKATVYLAEIEVVGETPGEKAKLVALASADLDGDEKADTVIGTGGGDIVALNASGKKLWQTKVGGAVTALAAGSLDKSGKPSVIYGTDDAILGMLAADGSKVADVKPPMYRGVPSRVRNITLADLDGDGKQEIVIGCDSWQYMAYSPALKLVGQTVYYAHGATVGHVADLDGDGKPEIIAGNAYYSLQILNHRGKIVSRGSGSFGPEQTAVTSGDLRGDGKRAAILGTDGGSVLAFDAKGGKLWEANVGDRVTTLRCDVVGGKPRVIAASESGYVWALDATGKPIWKRDLGEPVKRLARNGDAYIAAASANGIVRLSLEGKIEAAAATTAPVTDLVVSDDQAIALIEDGSMCGIIAR
ncbi:MAG: PQQ-binding-like beta-propeller repeat protein [Verrucomicrobia bacterium]|nr:PQQ-binding-like beta-propeller repeat protein [Verrucomicrobiota bacterium]